MVVVDRAWGAGEVGIRVCISEVGVLLPSEKRGMRGVSLALRGVDTE